jgi:citrate lyase subunit beta/citryl-CoA lyase
MTRRERIRRNMLLIPGNLKSGIQNALEHPGVDSVILDLEDLVAPSKKDEVRASVCKLIKSGQFQQKGIEVVVRINHPDTPYYIDDIHMLMEAKPDLLRIPKVECREDVLCVNSLVNAYEKKMGYMENTVLLMAAIESAKGILNAFEVATSCPRIIGMALSAADYCKDMKVLRTKESMELDWARGMLLNSARAAGVFAMDTSFTFEDAEALEREAKRAKAMGFDGKTVGGTTPERIAMIAVVNKVFSPTDEQISFAKKVLALEKEYEASGEAVSRVGDMTLDKPIVEQYRQILRCAGETVD